ncbi:MAG: hypothetical protein K5978_06635 [Campylobacter sp.]|nr:hypothetical protein [Campylobacter sp.]
MKKLLFIMAFGTFCLASDFLFHRAVLLDKGSYAYIVSDKNMRNIAPLFGFSDNEVIVAKMRIVNGQKEYYLQAYLDDKKTHEIAPYSKLARNILKEFEKIR